MITAEEALVLFDPDMEKAKLVEKFNQWLSQHEEGISTLIKESAEQKVRRVHFFCNDWGLTRDIKPLFYEYIESFGYKIVQSITNFYIVF